ncbi:MAG: MlaA family lipoprotein, partial [Paraburkholderia graminis]
PKHHQDFGLTLGHWGIPSGPYLVLPLFGPSTVRDSMGLVVDVKFNPLNYMEPAVRNPLYVLQFVSVRSDLLGATDLLQQAALDKYSFVRDAYTQQRRARLRGTSDNAAPLPEYDDEGDSGAATVPAKGAAAGAPAALPNYADPGDTAGTPDAASGAATGAPVGVPDYTDPGEAAAGGAAGGANAGANAGATAPPAASAPGTTTPAPQSAPADNKQPASAPAAQ